MQLSQTTILALLATLSQATTIHLHNWNLRYDSKKDGVSLSDTISSLQSSAIPDETNFSYYSDYTEETWSKRRIGVANEVIFNKDDVFCVNEALKRQVDDLQSLLNKYDDSEWGYVGLGRDDGKEAGEYEAIFYKKGTMSVESWYTVWLSNTYDVPSKYPGAGSYRTATIAHLKTNDGKKFTLINAHLDDKSDDQRRLGASMLRHLGAYEYVNSDGPVFLVGDFNSHADGNSDGAYLISTGALDQVSMNSTFTSNFDSPIASTYTWSDLVGEVPEISRSGHWGTWAGFKAWGDWSSLGGRIDFQFGGKPNHDNVETKYYDVKRYRVSETFYDMQFRLSDHRPIITDIDL